MSSIIIANEENAKYIAILEADIGKFLVKWALDNNMGMCQRGKEIKFFLNTKKQCQQLREKITNLNIRNDIIISQNKEEELMNKQTEKHSVTFTGITESGDVKKLDVKILRSEELEKENLNFEEEYLLINKLFEIDVKISAKLKEGGSNNDIFPWFISSSSNDDSSPYWLISQSSRKEDTAKFAFFSFGIIFVIFLSFMALSQLMLSKKASIKF
ncbi:MAG: hypothetical protein MUW51_11430 [Lactococcus lactis]|nr:hypothetical protein [Lactococcus lactis]